MAVVSNDGSQPISAISWASMQLCSSARSTVCFKASPAACRLAVAAVYLHVIGTIRNLLNLQFSTFPIFPPCLSHEPTLREHGWTWCHDVPWMRCPNAAFVQLLWAPKSVFLKTPGECLRACYTMHHSSCTNDFSMLLVESDNIFQHRSSYFNPATSRAALCSCKAILKVALARKCSHHVAPGEKQTGLPRPDLLELTLIALHLTDNHISVPGLHMSSTSCMFGQWVITSSGHPTRTLPFAGDHTEMLVCKYRHCSSRPKKTDDRAIIISGRFMASPSLLSRWAALAWNTCKHGRTGEMDLKDCDMAMELGTGSILKDYNRLHKLPEDFHKRTQNLSKLKVSERTQIATGVERVWPPPSATPRPAKL